MSSNEALKTPFGFRVAQGYVKGWESVQKFGHNHSLATSYLPVTSGGVYLTPQVASATTLRVQAGDVVDTADGAGARSIQIWGLNELGVKVTDILATAGTSPSTATTNTYIRIFKALVLTSGTYATSAAGSHDSAIVIENGAGGTDWLTIPVDNFPFARSQVGVFSVELGTEAYVDTLRIDIDSTKSVDVLLFCRNDILQSAAPYSSMQAIQEFPGMTGSTNIKLDAPLGPFPALSDLGFMAKGANTPGASVNFTILQKTL